MATGRVKWWNAEKGYGFISADNGGADVFAHYSEIQGTGFQTLEDNGRVEYDVGQGTKGPQALKIRKLDEPTYSALRSKQGDLDYDDVEQPRSPSTTPRLRDRLADAFSTGARSGRQSHQGQVGELLLPEDPRTIGRYVLARRLGEGAMGTVYLARRSSTSTDVAVKVVRSDFARDQAFRQRFMHEVATARRVQDFCTAAVLDADVDHGRPFLVTEFIDGPTLADEVAQSGPLPPSQVHGLAVGMAAALTAIHAAGIVHRDLKPSNVMLSSYGPKVIDFGIARSLDATSTMSQNMSRIGTPAYMSPEQIEGKELGVSSDIFSWGGVIIFAATGDGPFGRGDPMSLMFRIIDHEPKLDSVPSHIKAIVGAAMQKNARSRPTAKDLLDQLTAIRR